MLPPHCPHPPGGYVNRARALSRCGGKLALEPGPGPPQALGQRDARSISEQALGPLEICERVTYVPLGRGTYVTRSQISSGPSACSLIDRASRWPRACGGPGPGSSASLPPQRDSARARLTYPPGGWGQWGGSMAHAIEPILAMIGAERGASADASRSLPERIAALVPDDAIGPARQVTALARALHRAGIDWLVIVFHRRGRPPSRCAHYLQEAGVQHCVVEDRGPIDWRMALRVATILRRWRPSIVQT